MAPNWLDLCCGGLSPLLTCRGGLSPVSCCGLPLPLDACCPTFLLKAATTSREGVKDLLVGDASSSWRETALFMSPLLAISDCLWSGLKETSHLAVPTMTVVDHSMAIAARGRLPVPGPHSASTRKNDYISPRDTDHLGHGRPPPSPLRFLTLIHTLPSCYSHRTQACLPTRTTSCEQRERMCVLS